MRCAAYNCNEEFRKDSGRTFHCFPTDVVLRQQWIDATRRKYFHPSTAARLCSKHFQESDFEVGGLRRRLKKDVVPSIFEFPDNLQLNKCRNKVLLIKQRPKSAELSEYDVEPGPSTRVLPLKTSKANRKNKLPPGSAVPSKPVPLCSVPPLQKESAFTYVDVNNLCEEDLGRKIKEEIPDCDSFPENTTPLSITEVKMELEDEYDRKDFLNVDLQISDVAYEHSSMDLGQENPLSGSTLCSSAKSQDANDKFGEYVAQSLRDLKQDSSREKLRMLIDKAIKEVAELDQALSTKGSS